ncbi:putative ferric-chelate reductase 1 isoform X2 [Dreissena polymorpha]|nr:putative ferric-chelate reductase 1 isoform X2 [Dreissena polymorpha]
MCTYIVYSCEGFKSMATKMWIVGLLSMLSMKCILASVPWDPACGTTRGCFPDCRDTGCTFLVTWQPLVTELLFAVQYEVTATNSYVALGFSDDLRMGDDSVVACVPGDPTNPVQSWYTQDTDLESLSPLNTGLSAAIVTHANGVLACNFTRQIKDANAHFFNLNNEYLIMVVVGQMKTKHGVTQLDKHYMIPHTSDVKVDFTSTSIYKQYKLSSPLVKLHGSMMTLAWLVCCSIGIVIARYQKDLLPDKKLFSTKYWFQLHRGSMICVMIFGTVGFISIFVELKGYSQLTPPPSKGATAAHPVLGIIVTAIMFINPTMSMFRPDPDHKFRFVFNWAHLGVGVTGHVLAVVSTMIGLTTERAGLPTSGLVVGLLWLAAIIIMGVIMEILKWKTPANKTSCQNTGKSAEGTDKPNLKRDARLKVILLGIFCAAMGVFWIAIVAIIATY